MAAVPQPLLQVQGVTLRENPDQLVVATYQDAASAIFSHRCEHVEDGRIWSHTVGLARECLLDGFVVQGNSSAVALALSDAISKHNDRNPGKEVLYFNYAAVDPALTNEKCSFWHFRTDANADQKMEALTTYMTSGTKYAQARTATLNAARDLYGAGSAEYTATAAAWSAVNVA